MSDKLVSVHCYPTTGGAFFLNVHFLWVQFMFAMYFYTVISGNINPVHIFSPIAQTVPP